MKATLALLLAALLAACAPSPPHITGDPPQPADKIVYAIVNDNWHTELSLPAKDITGQLTRFRSIFPTAAYFTFGFGQRYYMMKDITDIFDKLVAVMPGPGTVMVTALSGAPPDMYPGHDREMVPLRLTQSELDRLADYMWAALEKTPSDQLVHLGDGKFPGYVFYGAVTGYSGVFTCNTWTVEGLDAAGLEAGAPGVLLASQAMERFRNIAARRPVAVAASSTSIGSTSIGTTPPGGTAP